MTDLYDINKCYTIMKKAKLKYEH